nr:unnamed protein product [Callosobruchus analis]
MPQGRRKIPFSGKAKKEQLKTKRQNKQGSSRSNILLKSSEDNDEGTSVQKINFQPSRDAKSKPNRYALQFFTESKEQIAKQKELAHQSLEPKDEKDLEVNGDEYFEYLKSIEEKFDWKDLSLFELNLETWRQLWRVLEMSDVILFIIDIRFGALMFPPSLYDYVVNTLKKILFWSLTKLIWLLLALLLPGKPTSKKSILNCTL